jgi:hypothetical protein
MGVQSLLVATGSGRRLRFTNAQTLATWIRKGRLTRSDRISKDGVRWHELGAVKTLALYFEAVERVERVLEGDTVLLDVRALRRARERRKLAARIEAWTKITGIALAVFAVAFALIFALASLSKAAHPAFDSRGWHSSR